MDLEAQTKILQQENNQYADRLIDLLNDLKKELGDTTNYARLLIYNQELARALGTFTLLHI